MAKKDDYPDPFEVFAEEFVKFARKKGKSGNGKATCPSCGKKLWNKKGSEMYRCSNTSCHRRDVLPEEVGLKRIRERFI